MLKPLAPGEAFALFEDRLGEDGALLFRGGSQALVCEETSGLASFFDALEAALQSGQWAVLAADYEAGHWFEPRLCSRFPKVYGGGGLRAWLFDEPVRLAAAEADDLVERALAAMPPDARHAGLSDVRPEITAADYCSAVRRIQDYIREGDCYQVNLTFGLDCAIYGDPLALYARLRQAQPVRHGAFLCLPGLAALSLSPELFLQKQGARLLSRPMKGTAARVGSGEGEGEREREGDLQARDALGRSAKNRAENVMIVDLIRNDLGRLARPGSVRVEGLCRVEAYPSVYQMVSDVSAEVGKVSLKEVFRALFPCGSITGAPKVRAMEIISELEPARRGLYTGSLGWLAPNGDFNLNVAIRTLVKGEDGRGRLGVGAGIVADSVAEEEWAESLAKARFATGLLPTFWLIETLRAADGHIPLLERHLGRLAASADSLGFRCDREHVEQQLRDLAASLGLGAFRLRLLLGADGAVRLESFPLGNLDGPVRVGLAGRRVESTRPLARHKTSVRQAYDADLAALPEGVFDLVYLNERGEVCEGARSNLFVQLEGRLFTPPVWSGLLPGVMRGLLLEQGRAQERVLFPEDLARAEALFLSNALRGLVPAVLSPGGASVT